MSDSKLFPGAFVDSQPDKPAVVMSDSGEGLTYSELDAFANRFARWAREQGVAVGDHLSIMLENTLLSLPVQWGAHYAGVYYTPISTRLTGSEAAYIVEDSGSKLVIVSKETEQRVRDGLAEAGVDAEVVSIDEGDGGAPLSALLEEFSGDPVDGAVDGIEMMYSSGTTGRPKGIKPSLPGTPLGGPQMICMLQQGVFGVTPNTVYLSPAPQYHASPFKWTQGITALGGTVVMMPRFEPEAALHALEHFGVTHSQWVPTMMGRLLRWHEQNDREFDFSAHKVAVHAAAPCPVPLKQAMIEWWGPIITEFYASTEGIGFCYCNSEEWLAHPGTVGRAVLGKVEIRGEDGEVLPTGEQGLVFFADGRPFEYHNDPEKTAEAYLDAGRATVGDMGRLDEDGYLYLTDRKSNLIITGGVNVYPQEAENLLAVHPSVADAAVIGVPNADFGEEVRAVVQLVNGVSPSPELGAELVAYTRSQLADVKCPRQVDFRDELPREPNGKLLKRKLRDEYWADRDSQLI